MPACEECLKKRSACILHQTFCIYCQREFSTPKRLQTHLAKKHENTYAEHAVREAREALDA